MSYTLITFLAVPVALAFLTWLLNANATSGVRTGGSNQIVFRVSPLVYTGFFALTALCVGFAFSALNDKRPPSAIITMIVISVCAALGSLAGAWWYAKCAVELTDEGIVLITPTKRTIARFDHLQDVRIASGMIILDEGKVPRMVIPFIYKNANLLVSKIESRRMSIRQRST